MRKKIERLFLVSVIFASITALTLSLVSTLGCGKKTGEGKYAEAIAKTRAYVSRLQEGYDIPGMTIAVAIDDSIVWSEGFGFANIEKRIPATPRTMFRVGSVAKVLTAGAVALLYEQGKLDLDAPVRRYVPEFPDKGYVITTRQIAGHLSGIRHYNEDEEEDKKHYDDVITALEIFKEEPLLHTPGERWSYSSYGWNLISAVVQRAAGQPFLEYMREHVFEPVGMSNTGPDDINATIPNRTTFYDGREVARDINISYKWASGGFLSTVEDLVRYGSAFLLGSSFLEMVGGQAILVVQPEDRIVVAMLPFV